MKPCAENMQVCVCEGGGSTDVWFNKLNSIQMCDWTHPVSFQLT